MQKDLEKISPFKPNYFSLSNGHRMHYVDEGEGHPIIFVHGNPTWSFFYRNLIKGLSPKFRCIAPDHLGCGLSDKPQDYSYRLGDHIANLTELMESLDLKQFHLVVHDWGGAIGLGFAEQFADKVERITIFNTAAFLSKEIPKRIALCRIPFLGELMVRGANLFAGPATSMAVTKKLPTDIKQAFLAPYGNWHDRIAIHRFVKDIPMRPSHPSYQTLQKVELGLPLFKNKKMLICWGAKDFCFNNHFYKEWRKRFPNAEHHYLIDAGHYLLEDSPEEVLGHLVKFLG